MSSRVRINVSSPGSQTCTLSDLLYISAQKHREDKKSKILEVWPSAKSNDLVVGKLESGPGSSTDIAASIEQVKCPLAGAQPPHP